VTAPNTLCAERHIRALGLAKECAALGARIRTIGYVTGMPHWQLAALFFPDRADAPRGRPPDSPEWYHNTNLLNRTEASIFMSVYRRIRALGFGPGEALVAGYKHYRAACRGIPRINFDRAFDLASHMDGVWLVQAASFSLATCPLCASQYATSVGVHPQTNHECPFCKLVRRYPNDPRIQTSFPVNALPDPATLQLGLRALSKPREQA
jgi:flagellar transcriptional activator FlhC